MKKYIFFLLWSLAVAAPSQAGVFGFKMGMSISQVKRLKGISIKSHTPRRYGTALEVTFSKDVMDMYVLLFAEKGLYKVIASRIVRTTNDGQGLVRDYFTARTAFKGIYGLYQDHEVVLDPIAPRGSKFMWLLKERKLRLYSSWPKYRKTKLKDHIRTIEIEIVAYSLYTGVLITTIEFVNAP